MSENFASNISFGFLGVVGASGVGSDKDCRSICCDLTNVVNL